MYKMYGKKSGGKKPPMKPPMKKKPKKLTDAQLKRLEKHSTHHTKKHMDLMKKIMLEGMSFKEAHELAQKKVGK
jgi:hypothetical protein